MENKEKMEEKLKEIFGYVNNWLNFAEAKNAAMLTVSIGVLFGLYSYIEKMNIIFYITLILIIIISILSSILSFYPNLGKSKIKPIGEFLLYIPEKFEKKDNASEKIKIFYGDIAKNYSEERSFDYVKDLYKDYYKKDNMVVEKSEIDYAKEIIINSKLTVNKYRYFKFSLKLFIIFIFLFFSVLSYKKIKTDEKKENNIKIEGTIIVKKEGQKND